MPYLSLLTLGVMVFVSTNIDNLLLLVVLFSDRRLSPRQVVLGQYLGFFALISVSIACSLVAIVISPYWLGLLGVWPLLVGVSRIFSRNKNDLIAESAQSTARSVGLMTVVLITLANTGDNFAVYTPLFANLTTSNISILVVELVVLIALFCAAARIIVVLPIAGAAIRRIAHLVLPYLLIGLGLWILLPCLRRFVSGT